MPKKLNFQRRRGESVVEAFEREIADLDRMLGEHTAGLVEFEAAQERASRSTKEARTALRIAREEG